jgi:membrane associated rhomboid family serine protease
MLPPAGLPPTRQPMFNIPRVVVALVGTLLAIHLIRVYVLSDSADFEFLLTFAFIPARITDAASLGAVPGGAGAGIWSFLTYAFLHGDWGHVGFNSLWLVAFGSPLAWRFGATRFLLFSAVGAVGGALAHLATHPADITPMVGASAAISAQMAGATRFVFTTGSPFRGFQMEGHAAYRRPAAPLSVVIRDRRVLSFVAIWFGLNLVFGLLGAGSGLTAGAIAWQAHVGGFLVGLALFSFFDPVPQHRPTDDPPPFDGPAA